MAHIFVVSEIRKKRIELKVTQEKMASLLGVTSQSYLYYEKKGDMWLLQALKCTEYLLALEELEKKIGR
jgi:DNA-binding XRE family transcriptional regulator